MNRKDYWNRSYLEYWKRRVAESGKEGETSNVISGDAKTEDDAVYEFIFEKHPMQKGSVLDVGCAWGRMFPVFKKLRQRITGVDISRAMIEEARKDFAGDTSVEGLYEAPAEELPFPDGKFDNVACLAVFDATFQDKALYEFLRVLKTNGMLYLTGKNDAYEDDDALALNAEEGARKKNHPNYFTDTKAMLRQLEKQGQKIIASYFFPRRGDFGKLNYVTDMPQKFYEYFLVVRKKASSKPFKPFSDSMSKTFRTEQQK
ncbi:MAG: hypothetical protein A2W52_01065 [Candidatus Taylorbacteria bacterium RIFCSPHIGHO2_02_49_25]|uniref:Methyltransferase type 11 domain-containing protein n=1 Tax=Candidatus Taylorbacteria bacterium RIFCSPHIGHO2_02_49_25 TaxID=1802305 RepID=A0A1G2MAX4_9BACT|nr:MAG: Ubiquinone/menaquinone biosynthesis methyltransferase UbiE [Parcubacteria group bacterium GW2011_GWF2_50_9]OHA19197.1 MAG: hypothetical protein A2759_00715 [Candidatus Taylorbacteria bacterium RIFCSPHIGHO2_01_FULL_49_60]OHA20973.1 MAG: hypothetical protein A2W52_01065 [Candidatus Taylorbacteria bacterium RIFCSPHIGHO2_02_49_25]OHA36338.1 MAG: hypothetical protein A3B27_02820 [Candidatus Taylorbacteria bacterium RIFCSPLOWO2_01_FULL_50_130]OHA37272.1 MAG: hypothetical protein A2W65_03310 [